jgi:NADPH-dependent curcumin reductase CurA
VALGLEETLYAHPSFPGYMETGRTTVYDDSERINPDLVLLNGGVLIKMLAFSIEPYMRAHMDEEPSDVMAAQEFKETYIKGEP